MPRADFNRRNYNFDSGVFISSSLFFLSSILCSLFPTHPLRHRTSSAQSFSFKNILIKVLTEIPNGFCVTEWRVLTGFSISYHFLICIVMSSSLIHLWGYQHHKDIIYFIINIKSLQYFNVVFHFKSYCIIFFNCMPLSWEFPQLDFFI